MNLVDRVNRQRSLTAISRTLRFGRIVANTSVPTTTYSYDANGNLIQAGGWSYMWDYLNRMLARATTTPRRRTPTTHPAPACCRPRRHPRRTTRVSTSRLRRRRSAANTYATSTNYIWNGDTLLATIDQKLFNGTATGTPITRYIHPDHLGSTNAVTDQNGNLVQLLDYYPYGATRVSTSYVSDEREAAVHRAILGYTNRARLSQCEVL